MDKLYRPRGTNKKTGRKSFLSTVWYSDKKYAENVVKQAGMFYTNIKMIVATNQTYKGKYIPAKSIVRHKV